MDVGSISQLTVMGSLLKSMVTGESRTESSTTYQKILAEKTVKTGMTFGGFDLLHLGHITLLRAARKLCEKLIVCVSSDEYILKHKGIKPLLSYEDRVHLINLTGLADEIVKQGPLTKKELVNKYSPDALFVGCDWTEATYEGEGLCNVLYLPHTDGVSTSWYREKLRSS